MAGNALVVDEAIITIKPVATQQEIRKFVNDFNRMLKNGFSQGSNISGEIVNDFSAAGNEAGKAFNKNFSNKISGDAAVKEIDRIEKEIKSLEDAMSDAAKSSEDFYDSDLYEKMKNDLSGLESNLKDLKFPDIDNEIRDAIGSVDDLDSAIRNIQDPQPITIPAPDTSAIENELNEIPDSGPEIGGRLGSLIVSGLAAVGFGALLSQALTSGLDLETSSAKLSAQLGLTAEEAEKYGRISGEIYSAAYGESAEEVNNALYSIIGSMQNVSSLSEEEISKMTKDVLNLSATYGLSTEQITSAAQSAIDNGFVSSWDEAVQLIVDGYTNMGAKGEDWADTIKEYSGDFKGLGLSATQSFNLVNKLLEAGIYNTDTAADSIREFAIRARTMDDAQVDALTAIGLNPEEIKKKAGEGGDALVDAYLKVQQRLQQSGDQSLYEALIGTQAEDQLQGFLNADWTSLTTSSAFVANNIDMIDQKLSETSDSTLEALKRQFEVTLGEIAIPLLEAVLPILQEFSSFLKDNKEQVKAIGTPLLIIGTAISAIIAGVLAFNAANLLLSGGLIKVIAATWAWTVALLANPITWIILAVIALIAAIVLLVLNWDVVIGFWTDRWNEFIMWLSNAWNEFVVWLGGIAGNLADLWNDIINGWNLAWTNFFTGIFNGINSVGEFFIGLGTTIGNVFMGVLGFVGNIVTMVISMFKSPINWLISALNFLIRGVNSIRINIPDWMQGFIGGAKFIGFNLAQIPQLANGATILPQVGGTLAVLGEAGRAETVVDEGKMNKNLDNQSRLMEQIISPSSKTEKIVNIKLEDRSDLDTREIAELLFQRQLWEAGV